MDFTFIAKASTEVITLANTAIAHLQECEHTAKVLAFANDAWEQFAATSVGTEALAIISRPAGVRVPDEHFDSWGHHWPALYELWMAVPFAIMFFIFRSLGKNYVFPPLAKALGLKGKKVHKFSYQGWLLFFYITSTIYGYCVQHDKPWLAFPMGEKELAASIDQIRTVATKDLAWYYSYQIGFFTAELYAIFTEPKRSDFYEYLAHHIVTLYLMIFSWVGYCYRIGAYILILHDIVDIFLCTSKMINYLGLRDLIEVPGFAIFTISYAYLRMYCLPVLTYYLITVARFINPSWNCQGLAFALAFGLQPLHIFWFFLILRIIVRLALTGEKKDVRSDNEDDTTKSSKPAKAGARAKKEVAAAAASTASTASSDKKVAIANNNDNKDAKKKQKK